MFCVCVYYTKTTPSWRSPLRVAPGWMNNFACVDNEVAERRWWGCGTWEYCNQGNQTSEVYILAMANTIEITGPILRGSAAQNWSTAVLSLSEWVFKLALNAVTDTLPRNVNLSRWKKLSSPQCQLCGETQSLAHVLLPESPHLSYYSARHDDCSKPSLTSCSTTWQPGSRSLLIYQVGSTPSRKTLCSDLVIRSISALYGSIWDQHCRSCREEGPPLSNACGHSHNMCIITLEAGSRGFLNTTGLQQLYLLQQARWHNQACRFIII